MVHGIALFSLLQVSFPFFSLWSFLPWPQRDHPFRMEEYVSSLTLHHTVGVLGKTFQSPRFFRANKRLMWAVTTCFLFMQSLDIFIWHWFVSRKLWSVKCFFFYSTPSSLLDKNMFKGIYDKLSLNATIGCSSDRRNAVDAVDSNSHFEYPLYPIVRCMKNRSE